MKYTRIQLKDLIAISQEGCGIRGCQECMWQFKSKLGHERGHICKLVMQNPGRLLGELAKRGAKNRLQKIIGAIP